MFGREGPQNVNEVARKAQAYIILVIIIVLPFFVDIFFCNDFKKGSCFHHCDAKVRPLSCGGKKEEEELFKRRAVLLATAEVFMIAISAKSNSSITAAGIFILDWQ
jgi:hypothetical protein